METHFFFKEIHGAVCYDVITSTSYCEFLENEHHLVWYVRCVFVV